MKICSYLLEINQFVGRVRWKQSTYSAEPDYLKLREQVCCSPVIVVDKKRVNSYKLMASISFSYNKIFIQSLRKRTVTDDQFESVKIILLCC